MMTLADLIKNLPIAQVTGSAAVPISAVVEDSREAGPGTLFVARQGLQSDGRSFIADAHRRGAVAVLSEDGVGVPAEMVSLIAGDLPTLSARLAERCLHAPSSQLALIGVTGTNGKTTTCTLLRHVLRAAGLRCGLIGTIELDDGNTITPAVLTTPAPSTISRWLRTMVDHGCDACAMEVSSHALAQHRIDGVRFRGALFTNLSGDHLDYHGSTDAYADAKARLFEVLDGEAFAVVNIDDPAAARMIRGTRAQLITVSSRGANATYIANVHAITREGVELTLHLPGEDIAIRVPLLGRHNVENALLTIAAAEQLGVSRATILDAIINAPAPPGRLERITPLGAPFDILVDYAHTDDALANVLTALRPIVPADGRLRVLFGCGGDRDRTKRPRMAQIAWSHADDVIVTSDNPRTEDPQSIVNDILAGMTDAQRARTAHDTDRANAIDHAVATLRAGDVLLLAGKGHEDYQIIGTTKRPFDDRLIGRAALDRHHGACARC